jgi:hypothetical protein
MCDGNSEHLRRTFMNCIKKASIKDVEEVFKTHETRDFAGGKYRVNKNLPPDTKLGSKDIVHAILTKGGWHCGVPQCGATLDEGFAIDMHLQAHGATALTKWYCGESSCYTGSARVFNDRESFDVHVADEHMNSCYSLAAARRVPKQEVLVTSLRDRLEFIPIPVKPSNHHDEHMDASTTFAYNDILEDTEPMPTQYDQYDAVEQEELAWAAFRRFIEAGEGFESDEDPGFLEHCEGRYVFLSKAPKGIPPYVVPPNYLVETLTGLAQMDEKAAKVFIKSYRQLCSLLGTNDANEVRRSLRLPLQDVSMRKELQNADQEAHDWQDTQSRGDEEPQINDQCSGYILRCPWPGCECTSSKDHKYAISAHFLSVHLNCVWQCREKGCEYCGYLVPEHLERHRMNCHVGSPLQCGHHDCNQVLVGETWGSRGHTIYATLRDHFETYFNQNLQSPRTQPSNSDSDLHYLSEIHEPRKPLPSEAEYMERFTGGVVSHT